MANAFDGKSKQILSALFGLAVGDALGVPVEFKSRSSLKRNPVEGMREFGTFLLKKRAEKKGSNIKMGTSVKIPAHFVPAFKPCKEFIELVKKSIAL